MESSELALNSYGSCGRGGSAADVASRLTPSAFTHLAASSETSLQTTTIAAGPAVPPWSAGPPAVWCLSDGVRSLARSLASARSRRSSGDGRRLQGRFTGRR